MKIDRRTAIKTSLLAGFGMVFTGNRLQANCLTTPDIEGPFYIPGSPHTTNLAPAGATGTPLFITGTVYAKDCVTPIADAVVDVWHANHGGGYDNNGYRGIIKTDSGGNYAYETILPGKYLNGSYYRPRHLHYKVSAPHLDNTVVLTTQIYFAGDTSIPQDPWASHTSAAERIITLNDDQQGAEHGVADFVINIEPTGSGFLDQELPGKPHIRSIHPTPASDAVAVHIVLAQSGAVGLRVFNLVGKEVARIVDDTNLSSGKHQFPFDLRNRHGLKLSPGIYIIQLWHDGVPADAKRFVVV